MMLGASFGVIFAGINALVQKSTGGDGTTAIIGLAVGILSGVAAGGIGYKIKMAKALQSGSSRGSGFGEYSSMDDFLANESKWGAKDPVVGGGSKAPKVSAKTAIKPSQAKPQVSTGVKPPQVQPKTQLIEKPVEIKAHTRQSTVKLKSERSSTDSSLRGSNQLFLMQQEKMLQILGFN